MKIVHSKSTKLGERVWQKHRNVTFNASAEYILQFNVIFRRMGRMAREREKEKRAAVWVHNTSFQHLFCGWHLNGKSLLAFVLSTVLRETTIKRRNILNRQIVAEENFEIHQTNSFAWVNFVSLRVCTLCIETLFPSNGNFRKFLFSIPANQYIWFHCANSSSSWWLLRRIHANVLNVNKLNLECGLNGYGFGCFCGLNPKVTVKSSV